MKKGLLLLLAALGALAVSFSARAEVYINQTPPEDWAKRELLRVIAVDTDRSDAMLLLCGGEAMLVDGGAGPYRDRLYAAADANGVTAFKYLFNSHSDNDHIHGLKYLMESQRYQVDMFVSPNAMNYVDETGYHQITVSIIRKLGIPYHVVEDGETLTLGSASMTVMRCMEGWGRNNRSATLMVTFGDSRIFFTGDIDNKTMSYYVEKYGADALRADIVKSPHHGIATMPDDFLQAVHPDMVFVNNLSSKVPYFAGNLLAHADWVKAVLFCGDAEVRMETDGTDWYVWQELP